MPREDMKALKKAIRVKFPGVAEQRDESSEDRY